MKILYTSGGLALIGCHLPTKSIGKYLNTSYKDKDLPQY